MPYGISHYKSLYRDSNDTIYLEETEGQVFPAIFYWSIFIIYFSLKFNAGEIVMGREEVNSSQK